MYAEGNLDEYLAKSFPVDYKGVIIDVGASLPIELSNSLYFEEQGWTAICIEPNPKYAAMLRSHPRKHVMEYAISNFDQDDVDFTVFNHPIYDQRGCSGLFNGCESSVLFQHYAPTMSSSEKIQVKVRKLDTLLNNEISFLKKIDILSVDVEGTELDVLRGFDLRRWMPSFVILEDFEQNNIKADFMKSLGYVHHAIINYNHVYGRDFLSNVWPW